MKFSVLSKHHSPVPQKLPIIIRSFYDDPAFSPDPLANPLFASHLSPSWSSPPGPGHPTLKKHPQSVDGEEFYPPQPPNTPAIPEGSSATESRSRLPIDYSTASSNPTRHTTSTSSTDPLIDSASLSLPSLSTPLIPVAPPSPPSPVLTVLSASDPHVYPEVEMSHHAHHHPSLQRTKHDPLQNPEPKKRQGLLSRLLGPPSAIDTSGSGTKSSSPPRGTRPEKPMLRTQRLPSHPTYDEIPRHNPVPVSALTSVPHHRASRSAPEVHQPERPSMPQRAKTAGNTEPKSAPASGKTIVPAVAVAAAAGRVADETRLRQDLDRIDELDETNPFGSALHHGGPYEAISRMVQKGAVPKENGRAPQHWAFNERKLVMSGDVYRNAQLMALQTGTLNLKPGQILTRDFTFHNNSIHLYRHPYPPQSQPQPDSHHDRHRYPQYNAAVQEQGPRTSPSSSAQMDASALQAGPPSDHTTTDNTTPSTSPPPTRHRIPSPTAATTHSSEDDGANLAIGMALMGTDYDHSHVSSSTAIVVGPDIVNNSPVPITIVLREPTEVGDPSPPPYSLDPAQTSNSRTTVPVTEVPTQPPAVLENEQREGVWDTPPMVMPRPFPVGVHTPEFIPVPAPIPSSSSSRHASWHPLPSQVPPPHVHSRSSRQDIHSLQPPPLQHHVNSGLSRSSTYAPGPPGPYSGGLSLASSTPSLRDRESDVRSVQQSIMTTSNASSWSQGENLRRNRYLPKRLVMPAPLQPAMQNQATTHQVRFDPQAIPTVYPRDPLLPRQSKRASLATRPSRAQDVPMPQSQTKLRKHISLIGGLTSANQPPPPPVAAVSFSANIVSADKHARGAEKVHRKVLSKRK